MKTKRLKRLRKAASLFCAVVMAITCAAMTVPETAYADDTTTTKGTIVVENDTDTTHVSIVGQTFKAYQIFTLTQDSAHSTYAYTLNSDYTDCFTEAAKVLDVDDQTDGVQYYVTDNTTVTTATLDVTSPSSVRAFMDSALYTWTLTTENGVTTGSKGSTASSELMQKFANALKAKLPDGATASTATIAVDSSDSTKETATFSDLALGYYLITGGGTAVGGSSGDDSVVAACILDTTTYDTNSNAYKVAVDIKVGVPTCDKNITKVDDENVTSTSTDPTSKAASGEIGDIVTFEVDSCLPNLTGYTSYTYTMKDTLSAGLDLVYGTTNASGTTTYTNVTNDTDAAKAVTVQIYNKTTKVYDAVNLDDSGAAATDWTYTFTAKNTGTTSSLVVSVKDISVLQKYVNNSNYGAGAAVKFIYSARINDDANIGVTGNTNTAQITYSNDPSTTTTNATPESKVKVYTFALELYKYTGDLAETNTSLKNAKFLLYDTKDTANATPLTISTTNNSDTPYSTQAAASVTVNSTTYTNQVLISDGSGKILVNGLKAGTYYLKEIEAPDGYNLKEDLIPVTYTPAYTKETLTGLTTTDTEGTKVLYQDSSNAYNTTNSSGNDSIVGLHLDVQNNTGTALPSTGGIGLTLLYIIGGLLMVVAVVSKTVKRLARDAR